MYVLRYCYASGLLGVHLAPGDRPAPPDRADPAGHSAHPLLPRGRPRNSPSSWPQEVNASLQVDGLDVRAALEAAGAGDGLPDGLDAALSLGKAMYRVLAKAA